MPVTPVALFRQGNASSPRFGSIRIPKDILCFEREGVSWVMARSGGISTFARPRRGRNWWILPAQTQYSDMLSLINDHDDHFLWEPAIDMPLDRFRRLLAELEAAFRRC